MTSIIKMYRLKDLDRVGTDTRKRIGETFRITILGQISMMTAVVPEGMVECTVHNSSSRPEAEIAGLQCCSVNDHSVIMKYQTDTLDKYGLSMMK